MKKGFTLIELIAVIVLLSIIALIVTPTVINITKDNKKNVHLASARLYLNNVKLAVLTNKNIADGTYNILESGDICLETYDYTTKKCVDSSDEGADIDILKVESGGDAPSGGTITFNKTEITAIDFILSNKRIAYNDKEEIIYFPCVLINGYETSPGSKYECEVKPGTKYNFYVISNEEDGTTNLIMDRNICEDGTPSTDGKACLVQWNIKNQRNRFGPVTAMTYLHNATKDWINIPTLNYTYMDKEIQGTTIGNVSYTSFVAIDGVATLMALNGTTTIIGNETEPLRTRLPIYSTDREVTEVATVTDGNEYLYENLDGSGWGSTNFKQPTNNISGIKGYWTLSSRFDTEFGAVCVRYNGVVAYADVRFTDSHDVFNGVRPVINLKL